MLYLKFPIFNNFTFFTKLKKHMIDSVVQNNETARGTIVTLVHFLYEIRIWHQIHSNEGKANITSILKKLVFRNTKRKKNIL